MGGSSGNLYAAREERTCTFQLAGDRSQQMGGVKDREAKKKANHVYRCASTFNYIRLLISTCMRYLALPCLLWIVCSGGSGGGTKGPSVLDKRKQQLQCPYCERIFQHKDRYQTHLASKHADEVAEADAQGNDVPEKDTGGCSVDKVMQVGSKAGYYTRKSPHLFLLEQCQSDSRLKPKIKVLVMCCALWSAPDLDAAVY